MRLFTSESVTEGHPDKVSDQIADTILDEILKKDPCARVACEVCCTTNFVLVTGEITTETLPDIDGIVRSVARKIGYDKEDLGFNADTLEVLVKLDRQSPDISMGVSESVEKREGGDWFDTVGAGDQGMMFGYASDETEELMPLAIALAHRLTERLTEVRKKGILSYLRPDGKAQVTVRYDGDIPVAVEAVVVSTQHAPDIDMETLRADVEREVIRYAIPEKYRKDTKIYINPTGRFAVGGPHGDSGVTGRKIIVDSYGGYVAHGGGAFSGKDPTKVDRSASYYARYAAKNIVAAGLAKRVMIQVAYAIGKAHPVSVTVDTLGTGKVSDEKITEAVLKVFDFRPEAIIENLSLRAPIYAAVTNYGHFGNKDVPWEKTDMCEELKRAVYGN